MSYFMNDLMGTSVDAPDEAQIRAIVASLSNADEEHADISLVHESGWSLSIYPDRTLVWENVEHSDAAPREISIDSWDGVIDALLNLSRGDIAAVDSLDWEQ
jgi:hypothetical protein